MKILIITTFISLGNGLICLSQDMTKQDQWMERNPNVLIIKSTTYDSFDDTQKALLKDYILIDSKLTLDHIEEYELKSKNIQTIGDYDLMNIKDGDYIKQWLALNPDVKILKQNYFQSLTTNEQDEYEQYGALILDGEEITKNDIVNYINTH